MNTVELTRKLNIKERKRNSDGFVENKMAIIINSITANEYW